MDMFSLLALGTLWRIVFVDGSVLDASKCEMVSTNAQGEVVYSSPAAEVAVSVRNVPGGVELQGRTTVRKGIVTDFFLPARMSFSPDDVSRVTFPGDKWMGTGYSLKEAFFRPEKDIRQCTWETVSVKGHGYPDVCGAKCSMRPLRDKPVSVAVTSQGVEFLGASAISVITNASYAVNRAFQKGSCDRIILDSPNGPLLGGSSLGGSGMLWRVGTASSVDGAEARLAVLKGCVEGVLRGSGKSARRKVAVLHIPNGPRTAAYCPASMESIREMVRKSCAERFDYVELSVPSELTAALKSKDVLLIVNPYTESVPVDSAGKFAEMLADIRSYVRSGGQWLEVGGLSFFKALVPRRWHQLGGDYPGLFADFVHWRWKDGGTCALMGLQPRPEHEPWKCSSPFVPSRLRIGGDESGGWVEHGFRTWVTNGVSWTTPAVRLLRNRTLQATCDEYVRANALERPLSDKVRDAAKLERLKRAPLLFVGDSCAKCRRAIPNIPVPSLIHQSQYLYGGFDKQYPDHLPPRASYGTQEEMLQFINELHEAGHLYSPYTNPTWWCDNPRGATFLAAGDAPLSIDMKGRHIHESYGKADGWTVCFWHPAVKAANRKIRRQFTEELPVDILFQDQCGVRRLAYDFNPAAPHPTAYVEGVISMVEEDSQIVPIGTEDGWDRIAREQTALCGLSWGTVPVHDKAKGQNILMKASLPADLWEIEAVPTRLFHDTCLFYLHDLGGFVHNERVLAWCLALGYQLSYRCNAWHFIWDRKVQAWYARLHELQSKIVSRYAGRKLISFRHDRTSLLARDDVEPSSRKDDGVVCAEYEGGAKVIVNLGDVPRKVSGRMLAPYGYYITVSGIEAMALDGQLPVVVGNRGSESF